MQETLENEESEIDLGRLETSDFDEKKDRQQKTGEVTSERHTHEFQ